MMIRRSLLVTVLLMLMTACSGASVPEGQADTADSLTTETIAEVEVLAPECGDGQCGESEGCNTCPDDCGSCCGNAFCDVAFGETCKSCEQDCGPCANPCGDGVCDEDGSDGYSETCVSCSADCDKCPDLCGNGALDDGEQCDDGNTTAGDGCDETCMNEVNPEDCPNGACEPDLGENCVTCPDDCKDCCPDGFCDATGDETCSSCPDDCGACPGCGDGVLQAEDGEQCDDGNTDPDDGCDENCQIEIVGVEPGAVVITEIMKDPKAVEDSAGEWVEVFNTTSYDIDLNGWVLKDEGVDDHTIFQAGGVIVPAEGFLVLSRQADPAVNGGLPAGYAYSGFSLANKDDEVILEAGGVVVDAVKYDDGVAFPDKEGHSLNLSADQFDPAANDLGQNWCVANAIYGVGDFGTPGEANESCGTAAVCGNDVLEAGEECDDGNTVPDDGCDELCKKEGPVCGDSVCEKDAGEGCADCAEDCGECPPVCGDGTMQEPEDCDDGNQDDCDGCTTACKIQGCGDGLCDCQEDSGTCPMDCEPVCGNNVCDAASEETCQSCPADCGACCPNGTCDAGIGETCQSCPADCGICAGCGNNIKEAGEECDDGNITDCDGCSAVCKVESDADGVCQTQCGETCFSNEADCGKCCGDGMCNPNHGETCATCAGDCGQCCGNGSCEAIFGENCTTCPQDCTVGCAAVCGNGKKETGEQCDDGNTKNGDGCSSTCKTEVCGDASCNNGETCSTCPSDCGVCPAAAWCAPSGLMGSTVTCELKLAAESAASPKATGVEFTLAYDSSKLTLAKLSCGTPTDLCDLAGILPSGHTVATNPAKGSWAGSVKFLIYHASVPSTPITDAYMSNGNPVGTPGFMKLSFTLKAAIPVGTPSEVTLSGAKATDANANPLSVTFANGILVTKTGAAAVCGDTVCDAGTETCQSCQADCGKCCGNGKVDAGEQCDDGNTTNGDGCSSTCQTEAKCPDAACNGTETCTSCPQDCGACPTGDWCKISGNQGATVNCEVKLAAATAASAKATGLEFTINYDSTKVALSKLSCVNVIDYCDMVSLLVTGHTIATNPAKGSWAGAVKVLIFHASAPATPITTAYMSGGTPVGTPQVMTLVFTLSQTIAAGTPMQVTLTGLKGTDAAANSLAVTMQNGILVSTP